MAWTDDRMDDLANRMAAGFARTDHQIANLRTELKRDIEQARGELKGDIEQARGELKGDIEKTHRELKGDIEKSHADLKRSIDELRSIMMAVVIAIMSGLSAWSQR